MISQKLIARGVGIRMSWDRIEKLISGGGGRLLGTREYFKTCNLQVHKTNR